MYLLRSRNRIQSLGRGLNQGFSRCPGGQIRNAHVGTDQQNIDRFRRHTWKQALPPNLNNAGRNPFSLPHPLSVAESLFQEEKGFTAAAPWLALFWFARLFLPMRLSERKCAFAPLRGSALTAPLSTRQTAPPAWAHLMRPANASARGCAFHLFPLPRVPAWLACASYQARCLFLERVVSHLPGAPLKVRSQSPVLSNGPHALPCEWPRSFREQIPRLAWLRTSLPARRGGHVWVLDL